ncbi:sugar phosphate isomerase/epimerase [Streptomyces sp. TS71-3]|uniref:sugar phosphate isomerase/epimerase family protein n=1 Tax=Streptomyces sp. TS71-3 TaxID=2733862 RepID=UPI001B17C07A|nr:sugar phosphate isomerase/epimerase [Streptomyces sp. TS71-3]GHJ41477.1 sugar phosphate isomerase [Streptomyces sp. TS71-3]
MTHRSSRNTPSSKAYDPEIGRRLSRRGMLGVAAGATAAALLGTATTAAEALPAGAHGGGHGHGRPAVPKGRLGIQLYTLRDKVASAGFAAVFHELELYGYDEIEFAGYTQGTGDITTGELRRLARDHGLKPIGSHVGYYDDNNPGAYTFAQNLTQVLDDAQALGLPHIGTASNPGRYGSTVDGWKRAAEEFNTYGAAARKRGMKFYQHNHSDEFAFASDRPDVRLYDVLVEETDPDLVFLEMDIYWAFCGQFRFSKRPDGTPAPFEPIDYVLRNPGRYPLFHVKDGVHDESATDGYDMVDVGDGDIDYQSFLTAVNHTRKGHDHHWQVEHDQPADSYSTARRSAAYLLELNEGR